MTRTAIAFPTTVCAVVVLLLTLVPVTAWCDDWPHWRGPEASGYVDAGNLAVEWSPQSAEWSTDLPGVSAATPVVSGERIFLNVGDGEELQLWALELETGEVLWRRTLGHGNEETRKQDMSSPSPMIGDGRVVVLTGTGVLEAFDFEGEELWHRELQEEYGDFGLNWGYASSPLLVEDTVYVQVLHGMRTDDPSYVVAVDADTGKNRWRVERPTDAKMESPDSYTTPTVLPRGDGWELVISGGDYVTGHDPETGEELWRLGGLNPEKHGMYRIVATPLVVADKLVVPSRVSPLLVFDTSGTGEPELAWKLDRGTDVPSPVSDGESLFVVNDRGILRRFDLDTGEETWEPQRLAQGNYSASPVITGGRLYVTNETGTTSVVSTEGDFELLAENETPGYVLASPAISDGRILLRTDAELFSFVAR